MDINAMCADEIEALYKYLNDNLKNILNSNDSNHNIIKREKEYFYCPECGSVEILRNGKTKVGIQKYICKDCHKSFSDTTNTISHYSKKYYLFWRLFVECEIYHLTIRESAEKLGININTAFFWRQKMHEAILKFIENIKLSGVIYLDATYTKINFKGTKPSKMVRKSKKRQGSLSSGLSNENICIMSGIDDQGNCFLEITNTGKESYNSYCKIANKITNPILFVTDKARGFKKFANEHNVPLEQVNPVTHKSVNNYNLSKINQLHSEFKSYLKKFNGVSTKHLPGYLATFIFLRCFKKQYEYNKLTKFTYKSVISFPTSITNKEIYNKKLPIEIKNVFFNGKLIQKECHSIKKILNHQ